MYFDFALIDTAIMSYRLTDVVVCSNLAVHGYQLVYDYDWIVHVCYNFIMLHY